MDPGPGIIKEYLYSSTSFSAALNDHSDPDLFNTKYNLKALHPGPDIVQVHTGAANSGSNRKRSKYMYVRGIIKIRKKKKIKMMHAYISDCRVSGRPFPHS